MTLVLAYLVMVAVETPTVPRHCGDICRLVDMRPSDMPDISGNSPEHPEAVLADYGACLASALERSTISAQSSTADIDRALQAVDGDCAAARTTGIAAFTKLVVDSGSHNTPAEIAGFADYVGDMMGSLRLMPVIARKVGPTKSQQYTDMVKAASTLLMARK